MANRSDPPGDGIAAAVDRMIAASARAEAEVERARRYAERLVQRLLPLDPPQRRLRVANVAAPMLRAVSYRLRDETRARRHTDPREALRLAELAVAAAERIEDERQRGPTLSEALAERGNAHRILGELACAEEDFAEAVCLLAEYAGDPLAEADMLLMRASLAKAHRRFAEAIELAGEACSSYARYGQVRGVLASLIKLGALHGYAGDHEEGIDLLGRALELAVDLGDSEDLLHVANNIALLFADAGLSADAGAVVERARELCDQVGTMQDRLRLDWLSARVQSDLGHHSAAAIILGHLRADYMDEDMPYEAALVSLELALAYARLGRRYEQRELARETAEAFQLLGVEREAFGALSLLAHADAEEAAELTARLTAMVRRVRNRVEP